jgi:signal transduction histidine kinase
MIQANDKLIETTLLSQELRTGAIPAGIGMLLLATATTYVSYRFAPIADPVSFWIWVNLIIIMIILWSGTLAAMILRDPDDNELVYNWLPRLKIYAFVVNILVAASVWILLPFAEPDLHEFMMVMYVWFILIQTMGETRASSLSGFASIIVLSSVAIFEFSRQSLDSIPLAIFMLVFAASMLAFQKLTGRTLLEMIRAKVEAENAGRALNSALEEVEAQRDAISRFLASASHDLQQPIQAARLFFDQAVNDTDSASRQTAVEGASRAFGAAQSLLGEMLEHLRQESSSKEVRSDPIDLDPVIREIAFQYATLAQKSNMMIRTNSCEQVVLGDPGFIRRILGNLVSNAIAHSKGHRVFIGVRRRKDQVLIYVIDDGEGIPQSSRLRIFDEYNSKATNLSVNFGLGLSTSRRFARLMGGNLIFDQRWTSGACFVVELAALDPTVETERHALMRSGVT